MGGAAKATSRFPKIGHKPLSRMSLEQSGALIPPCSPPIQQRHFCPSAPQASSASLAAPEVTTSAARRSACGVLSLPGDGRGHPVPHLSPRQEGRPCKMNQPAKSSGTMPVMRVTTSQAKPSASMRWAVSREFFRSPCSKPSARPSIRPCVQPASRPSCFHFSMM